MEMAIHPSAHHHSAWHGTLHSASLKSATTCPGWGELLTLHTPTTPANDRNQLQLQRIRCSLQLASQTTAWGLCSALRPTAAWLNKQKRAQRNTPLRHNALNRQLHRPTAQPLHQQQTTQALAANHHKPCGCTPTCALSIHPGVHEYHLAAIHSPMPHSHLAALDLDNNAASSLLGESKKPQLQLLLRISPANGQAHKTKPKGRALATCAFQCLMCGPRATKPSAPGKDALWGIRKGWHAMLQHACRCVLCAPTPAQALAGKMTQDAQDRTTQWSQRTIHPLQGALQAATEPPQHSYSKHLDVLRSNISSQAVWRQPPEVPGAMEQQCQASKPQQNVTNKTGATMCSASCKPQHTVLAT